MLVSLSTAVIARFLFVRPCFSHLCDLRFLVRYHCCVTKVPEGAASLHVRTLLGPQSRFVDKLLNFQVLCPQERHCSPKKCYRVLLHLICSFTAVALPRPATYQGTYYGYVPIRVVRTAVCLSYTSVTRPPPPPFRSQFALRVHNLVPSPPPPRKAAISKLNAKHSNSDLRRALLLLAAAALFVFRSFSVHFGQRAQQASGSPGQY